MNKYIMEQNGRSMIEMLGVLAIVGVLSVAGIAGYSKAMAKYKVNKLIDQISTIAANVRTKFAAQGNYNGLDQQTAYQLGIFPEDVAKECDLKGGANDNIDDCPKNTFGGSVFVLNDAEGKGEYSFFEIGVDKISKDACASLIGADWGGVTSFEGIKETSSDGEVLDFMVSDGENFFFQEDLKKEAMKIANHICDCSINENTCNVVLRFK